jgi:hypothetical protein
MLFTVPSNCGYNRKPYPTLVLKIHKKNPGNKTLTKNVVQEFHLRFFIEKFMPPIPPSCTEMRLHKEYILIYYGTETVGSVYNSG